MLSDAIQSKILAVLSDTVLSTSMIARRSKLSRITVAKYLSSMESRGHVEVARVGKALAWRRVERKPIVAIIAKTGTARVVQLALGDEFDGLLATSITKIDDAFCVVTDQPRVARTFEGDVILIGGTEENAYCVPELFEISELASLLRKLYLEQQTVEIPASSCIAIEHIEECEDLFGFHAAEELIRVTEQLLEQHSIAYTQVERTYFLVEGLIPEAALGDIEQMFHTVLAHLYGEMVNPGEEMAYDGINHVVPCLTITLAAPAVPDRVAQTAEEKH